MAERGPRSPSPVQPVDRTQVRDDPAPLDRASRLTVTWAELRAALATVHYSAIPAWDEAGQARIDRATDRLVAELTR